MVAAAGGACILPRWLPLVAGGRCYFVGGNQVERAKASAWSPDDMCQQREADDVLSFSSGLRVLRHIDQVIPPRT